MRRIIMLVRMAGRSLAADGVPLIDSRYARRVLVLSAMLTAAMVVGLLGYATPSRADVTCLGGPNAHCLEKTADTDPVTDQVKVGEPLTFTISIFCVPGTTCRNAFQFGLSDTLPAGLAFFSASATANNPDARCNFFSDINRVDCSFLTWDQNTPYVATIKVIPKQCGTFMNTATFLGLSASENYTVVQCPPPTKEECKNGGWSDPEFAFPNQGTCVSAVNRQNRQ
jgi:uncharacterized repeat protein (TIGR01451 family)